MSASFAYEDPILRSQSQAALNNSQKAKEIFKDMGKGMWRTGKGFGKVGALFAGTECVIEGVSIWVYRFHHANLCIHEVSSEKRHCEFCCCRIHRRRDSRTKLWPAGRVWWRCCVRCILCCYRLISTARTRRVSAQLSVLVSMLII